MASTSSATVAFPQGHASRRHWDHKQLAEQWVTADRGPAGSEKAWVVGGAGAGAVLMLALGLWLRSGPAPVETVVPAPRVVQPAAPAVSVDLAAQAKVEKMRREQIAFLSRLATVVDQQEKRQAASDAAAKKKAPATQPAASAPAKPMAAVPAPSQQSQQVASIAKPSSAPVTAPAASSAKAAEARPAASCKLKVADLSASHTLTYDAVAGVRGAKKDPSTGVVHLPPVDMEGRSVVLDVRPDGCVDIVRSSRIH